MTRSERGVTLRAGAVFGDNPESPRLTATCGDREAMVGLTVTVCSEADGAVISRFIRTNFGRNLRRQLGTRPWRTCGSAGMGRMRALVVELASELERQAVGA